MSKFDQKKQKVNTQLNADKINIGLKSITCPNCQHGSPAKAKFCAECGTSLIFNCPLCNSDTPLGSKFCSGCGKEIKKIILEIETAKIKRGSAERELVYEFRSKPFNPLSISDQLSTIRGNARMTLDIDEYVQIKEDYVDFYKGGGYKKEADGCLYLTNKRLIFLGREAERGVLSYENPYPLKEISEVSVQVDKILFITSSYVKIIWNGNVRKFSFGSEEMAKTWVEAINAQLG